MFYELNKEDFYKVNGLFPDLRFNLSIDCVINSSNSGRVFVDSVNMPTIAFLISPEGMYLGGNPSNGDFCSEMNQALKKDIRMLSIRIDLTICCFTPLRAGMRL